MDERKLMPLLFLSTDRGCRPRRRGQNVGGPVNDFAFSTASGVSETFVADGHRVALIAGGTELLNWMRLGIADPQKVVDISRLENMDAIWIQDGYLVIGSLATLNSIGENSLVVEHARTLAQACLSAASPQVRNRATLGGNVLQKTRGA